MMNDESRITGNVLVRFAPSPTGWLHVGNVRTAIANFLFAKSLGGKFMLRIDDTDRARSEAQYEAGLKEDLAWLGVHWDVLEKQSDRFARYELAKADLIAKGRLYPCYETAEEIDIKRKMLIGRGLPPIYDRSALNDTPEKRAEYEAQGRTPHWRFKLDAAPIIWEDMVRGKVEFDGSKLSDPVMFREDGVVLFTFATSVDDGELGITHIIRGEDHVSNTAMQVQIMQAMGHEIPTFGHMALLKMKEGKISKRVGGGDIRSLRDGGIFPLVLMSYLAKIGTSDAIELADSMEALISNFAISKLGRAMANYDPLELERLNQKLLHQMPFADVAPQLAARGMSTIDATFWEAIKANLTTIDDTKDWWEVLHQPITPVIEDKAFADEAAACLPVGEWNEASWDVLVNAVKEKTGRKGKELFMPLRLALTGREHGPEMKTVLALLGRDRAEKRLMGQV
ncbi:MAG: glutamate--tRNA ligase, partial [Rickettsiales bacterium]|nr:glutamate--tRNA ligase [Rickettsiales bacterium]